MERQGQVGRPAAARSCRRSGSRSRRRWRSSCRRASSRATRTSTSRTSRRRSRSSARRCRTPSASTSRGRWTTSRSAGVDPAFNRHVEDLTKAWAERRVVRFRYQPARYDGTDREPRTPRSRRTSSSRRSQTHALYLIGFDQDRRRDAHVQGGADRGPGGHAADVRGARSRRARAAAAGVGHHRGPAGRPRSCCASTLGRGAGSRRRPGTRASAVDEGCPTARSSGARRVAGHDRDPALDPSMGRRRRGARAGGAAGRRRRDASHEQPPATAPVRRGWTRSGRLTPHLWAPGARRSPDAREDPVSGTADARPVPRAPSCRAPRLPLLLAAPLAVATLLGVAAPASATPRRTMEHADPGLDQRGPRRPRASCRTAGIAGSTSSPAGAPPDGARPILSHSRRRRERRRASSGGRRSSPTSWYGEAHGHDRATAGREQGRSQSVLDAWKASAPHRALIMSTTATTTSGIGRRRARATGRSGPRSCSPTRPTTPGAGSRNVSRRPSPARRSPTRGAVRDVRLQRRTSGLRSFDVQYRVRRPHVEHDPERHLDLRSPWRPRTRPLVRVPCPGGRPSR